MDTKEAREILLNFFMTLSKKEIVEFTLDIITDGYPKTAIKYAGKIKALGKI